MTGVFRDQQWQAGMEISDADLTAITRRIRSQVFDTLAGLAIGAPEDLGPDPSVCFSVGNGGMPVATPRSTITIGAQAGVLLQAGSRQVTGDDAAFAPFYVDAANDLLTTFDGADSSPRWDVVCIKIDGVDDDGEGRAFVDAVSGARTNATAHPTRMARVSKVVLKGIPGANPVERTDIPNGFAKWASLYIPAGSTQALAANIRDYRMPIGLRVIVQPGTDFVVDSSDLAAGFWRSFPGYEGMGAPYPGNLKSDGNSDGRGPRVAALPVPGGPSTRVISVRFQAAMMGENMSSVRLERVAFTGRTTILDLTSALGQFVSPFSDLFYNFEVPLWGGGYTSPYLSLGDNGSRLWFLVGAPAAASVFIQAVRWTVAG